MLRQPDAGQSDGGEHRSKHDGSRALDVVVERADLVGVAVQDPVGVTGAEVLPVQHRVGEELVHRLHEGLDELVVALTAHAGVLLTQIQVAVEQAEVVGADVDHHGDRAARMDAGRRGVHAQLADRDLDSPDALVADAEDALGVGDHNQIDVVRVQFEVSQRLLDEFGVVDGEEQAAGADVLVAEPFDRLTDGRGVDDRQHLFQVLAEQPVEQHLVAVTQLREVDELRQRGR
jgi:hypothetical protein